MFRRAGAGGALRKGDRSRAIFSEAAFFVPLCCADELPTRDAPDARCGSRIASERENMTDINRKE